MKSIVAAGLMLLGLATATGQIEKTATNTWAYASASTETVSAFSADGASGYLLVAINSYSAGLPEPGGVTFGGVALAKLASIAGNGRLTLWGIATQGVTGDIVASFSPATSEGSMVAVYSTNIGSAHGALSQYVNSSANTLNFTTTAGDVVISALDVDGRVVWSPSQSWLARGWTDNKTGILLSQASASGASTAMTWTLGGSYYDAQAGIVLTPAPPPADVVSATVTSPSGGSSSLTPGTLTFSVSASSTGAAVTNLSLYHETTNLIGSAAGAGPFTIPWTNPPAGVYLVSAWAQSSSGSSAWSSPVSLTVTQAPDYSLQVSITSPVNGAALVTPTNLTLSASVTDTNGTASSVTWKTNGVLLATVSSAPWSYTWANVPAGDYTLGAVALDNNSHTTTAASVSITVSLPIPPAGQVRRMATNSWAWVAAATESLPSFVADGADGYLLVAINHYSSGGSVDPSGVLFAGTIPLVKLTGINSSGRLSLWGVATQGITGDIVASFSPATSEGSMLAVYANNIGSAFGVLSNQVNSSSNSLSFSGVQASDLVLSALDVDGRVVWSPSQSWLGLGGVANKIGVALSDFVAVSNGTVTMSWTSATSYYASQAGLVLRPKAAAPFTCALTAPSAGWVCIVPTNLTLSASAADVLGAVTNISFFAGTNLIGSVSGAGPYSVSWSNTVALGTVSLSALAKDNAGNSALSPSILVTLAAPTPSIAITSPANNAYFIAPTNLTLTCDASEAKGAISSVTWRTNGVVLATLTNAPYSFSWSNVTLGRYTLSATALDTNNVSAVSASVTLNVVVQGAQSPMPVGIPDPLWGIAESVSSYYGSSDYYTYWIDNTAGGATDTDNAKGSPGKPRLTFPLDGSNHLLLYSGDVVQVRGGPYVLGATSILVDGGNPLRPVFISGGASTNDPKPEIRAADYNGTFRIHSATNLYLENLYINNSSSASAAGIVLWPNNTGSKIDHVAIRGCVINTGPRDSNGHKDGIDLYVSPSDYAGGNCISHVVVFGNTLTNIGSFSYPTEDDSSALDAQGPITNVWVLNNVSSNTGGNAAGGGGEHSGLIQNFYVGRNVFYHQRESCVDIKSIRHVVISENDLYDIHLSSSSLGQTITLHEGPQDVWILNNRIHDTETGIKAAGGGWHCTDIYIIGNLFYDLRNDISTPGNWDQTQFVPGDNNPGGEGAAAIGFISWGDTTNVWVCNNTFDNYGSGTISWGNIEQQYWYNNLYLTRLYANGYDWGWKSDVPLSARNAGWNYVATNPPSIGYDGNIEAFEHSPGSFADNLTPVIDPPGDLNLRTNSWPVGNGTNHGLYDLFYSRNGLNIAQDLNGTAIPQNGAWHVGALAFNAAAPPPINNPPLVSLTSPGSWTVSLPTNISVGASALSGASPIASVGVYDGSTQLVSFGSAPYAWTWTNPVAGLHNLSARATDGNGLSATSAVVTLTVATNAPPPPPPPLTNQPPVVSILAPQSGLTIAAQSSVALVAQASDPDGDVVLVQWRTNGITLAGTYSAPFSYLWTNIAPGTYYVSAAALDNSNAVTVSSAVTLIVSAALPPHGTPFVTASASPTNNAIIGPSSLLLSANPGITGGSGSIVSVAYRVNGALLGTVSIAPWRLFVSSLNPGHYSIVATVTDDQGNSADSPALPITIAVPPAVLTISGTNGIQLRFSP